MFGPPSIVDYNMAQENIADAITNDTEAHSDLTRAISSVASILQAFGLGLIGYALLRGLHDGKNEHTALRVTPVIVGILVLTSIVSQQVSLF
jgi:hypothetical protein